MSLPEDRIARLEERMARIEGILEEIRTRLNHLETRLDSGLKEIRQRQDRFLWLTLGVLIPMWVTIILTIVFT